MAGSLKFDDNGDTDSQHDAKEQLLRTSGIVTSVFTCVTVTNVIVCFAYFFTEVLLYACLSAFAGGVLLIVSFASPYWLVSWEGTQSPFKNMGLWEFCFYKFHHPDYQFDHLFNGCHALYGDEYRLIREKLLPGTTIVCSQCTRPALMMMLISDRLVDVGPAFCHSGTHLLLRGPGDTGGAAPQVPLRRHHQV